MKKVLIISYYWPPISNPGVQRWLQFSKYLSKIGHEIHVITPEVNHNIQTDETIASKVFDSIIVTELPSYDIDFLLRFLPGKIISKYRKGIIPSKSSSNFIDDILLFLRGNFFIPDPKILWARKSFEIIKNYINDKNIKTIITTGPPFSMHILGNKLKDNVNVKWIADFRDPWTDIWYHKRLKLLNFNKKKHLNLEKKVLNEANHIIVTSDSLKNKYSKLTNVKISTITNGYDFKNDNSLILDKNFTISHIGSLLSDRNPLILWRILKNIIKENSQFRNDFNLQLVGNVSNDVLNSIYKYIPKNNISIINHTTHQNVIKFLQRSQILLLIQTDKIESNYIIPGKLFEYINSNRPILSISNNNEVDKIIKECKVGKNFKYNDDKNLYTHINKLYSDYNNNSLEINPYNVDKYSRLKLSNSLSKIIQE